MEKFLLTNPFTEYISTHADGHLCEGEQILNFNFIPLRTPATITYTTEESEYTTEKSEYQS